MYSELRFNRLPDGSSKQQQAPILPVMKIQCAVVAGKSKQRKEVFEIILKVAFFYFLLFILLCDINLIEFNNWKKY